MIATCQASFAALFIFWGLAWGIPGMASQDFDIPGMLIPAIGLIFSTKLIVQKILNYRKIDFQTISNRNQQIQNKSPLDNFKIANLLSLFIFEISYITKIYFIYKNITIPIYLANCILISGGLTIILFLTILAIISFTTIFTKHESHPNP